MAMSRTYLAFFFQAAWTSSFADGSTAGKICNSRDSTCTEPSSSHDAQILLQSQTKMEVAKQSQSLPADKGTTGEHLHVEEEVDLEETVNPHDYINSMTITAAIRMSEGTNPWPRGQLVAYIDGNIQGVYPNRLEELLIAPPVFPAPWGGNPSYHLMVHGHESDENKAIALKLFSIEDDFMMTLKCLNGSLNFGADNTVGNAMVPAVLIPDWEAAEIAAAPAPTPAPAACEDASPTAFNAWIDVKFPGYGIWGPYSCSQFVAWGQCTVVSGQCDESCGVCPGLLLTEKKLDVAKSSKSLGGEALKQHLQTLTKVSAQQGLETLTFDKIVTPSEYENSMTVTMVVKIGDEFPIDGKVIATVGGHVQGIGTTSEQPISPFQGTTYYQKPIHHMMIYGNGGDENEVVEFVYITPDHTITDLKRDDDTPLTFKADDHLGNAIQPVEETALHIGVLVEA